MHVVGKGSWKDREVEKNFVGFSWTLCKIDPYSWKTTPCWNDYSYSAEYIILCWGWSIHVTFTWPEKNNSMGVEMRSILNPAFYSKSIYIIPKYPKTSVMSALNWPINDLYLTKQRLFNNPKWPKNDLKSSYSIKFCLIPSEQEQYQISIKFFIAKNYEITSHYSLHQFSDTFFFELSRYRWDEKSFRWGDIGYIL